MSEEEKPLCIRRAADLDSYELRRLTEANKEYIGNTIGFPDGTNSRRLPSHIRDRREFLYQLVTFAGINFDPLFSKLAAYPAAGMIVVVPLVETLVAPLTRATILSQIDGASPASSELRNLRRGVAKHFKELRGHGAKLRRGNPSQLRTVLRAVRRWVAEVIREQGGCKALWDGNWISILHGLAFYGTNLLAYRGFKCILQSVFGVMALNRGTAFACGVLSTLIASFISHPLDTLRTCSLARARRNQLDKCISFLSKVERNLFDEIGRDDDNGFTSLYAGLLPSLLGAVVSLVATVIVYEPLSISWHWMRPTGSRFMINLTISTLAGLAASTVTFPMEVVKTRMQVEGREELKDIDAIRETFEEIVQQEGVDGLYRGVETHCLKVVVGHVAAFLAYEVVRIPFSMAVVALGFTFGFHE